MIKLVANEKLAKELGVEHNLDLMKITYASIEIILSIDSKHLVLKEDREIIIKSLEDLEFYLQGLWGFKRDKNFHKYWLEMKGCTCPKMDNDDRFGTNYRIYNSSCPWHGDA